MQAGDRVLRKRGTDAHIGIIRAIRNDRADVDWPAPRRIGGRGWHRSTIAIASLIPATDEEIQRRRAANKTMRDAGRAERDASRTYLCPNVNPAARVANDGHRKPLPLMPSQVKDGRCIYCCAAVVDRQALTHEATP